MCELAACEVGTRLLGRGSSAEDGSTCRIGERIDKAGTDFRRPGAGDEWVTVSLLGSLVL